MLSHFGWAMLLTSITAILHGICTAVLMRSLYKLSHRHAGRPFHRTDHLLLLVRLVVGLLLAHCLEALAWAVYYVRSGGLADMEQALYFSLTSYTTIGYGDVLLPANARLVGAVEGLAGTFMCGWSVALLVTVVQYTVKALHASAKARGQESGD